MRKQIDPNLNSDNNIEMLLDEVLSKSASADENEEDSTIMTLATKSPEEAMRRHHHHSSSEHHHSSGEHHHSSGEHHHSSGEHHHSNGEHHHSSGEHHHSNGEHHHSSGEHHHSSGEHHHSSNSSSKKKKDTKKTVKRILIILLILILVVTGSLGGLYYFSKTSGKNDLMSSIKADTLHQEIIEYKGHKYEFNKNVVSVAFLGVDQRSLSGDNEDFVGCADADIVLAIDTQTGRASIISVPRDSMVDIRQYRDNKFIKTDRVQLCLAYAYGDGKEQSCRNVTKAISTILMAVPIEKYFALDLEGIKPLNDAIGGVTLEAKYDIPQYNIEKGKTVTLRGDMAEAYVRTRDMDKIDASIERKERQEQYIRAFVQQVLPSVKKNFSIIADLYNTASDYSRTNVSLNNATYLASLMLSKNITDFTTYSFTGTLTESVDTEYPEVVHAELTPDEDSVMEAVLAVYYTQIS